MKMTHHCNHINSLQCGIQSSKSCLRRHCLIVFAAVRPQQTLVGETVPEVGWMWQKGSLANENSSGATRLNLKQNHLKPKKSLGQNFCTDHAILRSIVAAADVRPGEPVLEIGPGTGNLTKHLLAAGADVTAIEKDDALHQRLSEQYKKSKHLRLIHDDVLRVDTAAVVAEMLGQERQVQSRQQEVASDSPSSSGRVKVVANLPYNITKDFLKLMLPLGHLISELHIMIQDEVAERLCFRGTGASDYRAMNLTVQYFSRPKYRFKIPRTKYFPEPAVDGALVTFTLLQAHQRVPVPSERVFFNLVNKAFSERRKMMRNSLQPLYDGDMVVSALEDVGLPIQSRAQDLSLPHFAALSHALHKQRLRVVGLDESQELVVDAVEDQESV